MTTGDRPTDSLDGYVPFPDDRREAYRAQGHWRDLTFHDVLDRAADASPSKTAVIGPHRDVSYITLAENSRRIAAGLMDLGIQANERVILQLPNCTEFLEVFFACSRVGAIPVTVLPRHREAEVRHVIDLMDAVAYVTNGDRYEMGFDYTGLIDDLRDESPTLDHTIAVGEPAGSEWVDFDSLREQPTAESGGSVDPSAPGVMLLSGGTTGMPKGIPRTHNDYVFQWEHMADVAGVSQDWVAFPSVPIGHNASLCCVVGAAIWRGATLALEPELKPEALMALIEAVGGNYSLPMPTQILDILEHPNRDAYDLSSLKVLVSGGQKVPPRAVYESVDRWGVGFCNIFGMAEGPLICTRPDDDVDVQATTVGRPIAPAADELLVVDFDRESALPAGETGELAVRGPGFFTGYFRNAQENDENVDEDGWFYTEDILAQRSDGNYEVYGRIKDTIIRGGETIYAPGVEDQLVEHPKVANIAVVGKPDDRLGQRPFAFVEPPDGSEPPSLDELQDFLAERGMAVFKRPEELSVLSDLPRTGVGKIDKAALEERVRRAEAD